MQTPAPSTINPSARPYEVQPNPATLPDQVGSSARRVVATGYALGQRVLGSERLFRRLSYVFELVRGLLILTILGVLVHLFVATVFRISGESMLGQFQDGQFVLVDHLTYLLEVPKRGDVVVLEFPGDPGRRKFIKRIIGLPGETVEIKEGAVFINGQSVLEPYLDPTFADRQSYPPKVLRGDEVYVMGDNRANSNDSRYFGPLPIGRIIGKSQARLSGRAFGWVAQPAF